MTTSKFIWIPLAICLSFASVSTRFAGAAWAWLLVVGLAALWTTQSTTTRPASLAHELARTWLIFTAVALALKTVPMLYWHDPWEERHAELRLLLGALGLWGLTRLSGLSQKVQEYLMLAGSIYCTAGLAIILLLGISSPPTNPIPWATGMTLVSCWLLGVAFTLKASWARWLALASSIAGLLAVLASEKRGTYSLLIVLPCMAWFLWRQQTGRQPRPARTVKSWAIYLTCALLAVASLWSLKDTPVFQRPTAAISLGIQEVKNSQTAMASNYNTSLGSRLYVWMQSSKAVTESPWIGYGHDQRKQLLQKWANDTNLAEPWVLGHVHNEFLHSLVDHGLWGLASYLTYAAGLIVLILKLARRQSWVGSATLAGMLTMHLSTALSNVNFAHNYYPTMLSLMICLTLWSTAKPKTTKAP